MPSVEVVIPCYNYAHYLPQCVGSVLAQDIDNLRIVIIDNASTDNSVEVARWLARQDSRVELVNHATNLGPHASFNEGIERAKGDYFMILCADDVLAPGALRRGIKALEANPAAAMVLGAKAAPFVGDTPPEPAPQTEGWTLQSGHEYISQCCRALGENSGAHAMLVRTRFQHVAGSYRSSLTHMDDLEMAMRLACLGPVATLSGALVIQRMHSTNQLSSLWQDRLKDLKEREAAFSSFFNREGRHVASSGGLRQTAESRIAEAAFWSAASHLYRRKWSAGLRLLKYSLRIRPHLIIFPPIGHLVRTDGALRRMATVLSGGAR